MTLKLVFQSEASSGPEELLLSRASHGIGRLHDNDLSIQIDCVSGYHAELKRTPDGGYTINDLKSTNGTFLNGIPVTSSPERVKSGDRLKFGNVPVLVQEHIEVVARPEKKSLRGDGPSQVVSLKDVFGFASGDHFNTFPITPIRPQAAMTNGGSGPVQPVKMAPPVPTPAMAAQQLERAQHLERVQQLERAQQIERAKEAERARQIEQAKEAERVRQIEAAKEAERLRQIEQEKEAERVRQIEAAKEAERLRQIEQAKEAERLRQIEQAKEAERLRQVEQAREAERLRQVEQAREAERLSQIEQAREAQRAQLERVQQLERAKKAELMRQIEQDREAEQAELERVQQLERAREAERMRRIEHDREAERAELERVRQLERAENVEPFEVNLQRSPAPSGSMDIRSTIQSLTTQLESAMREIGRLKASMASESPQPFEMNGNGARPAHPGHPDEKGMPAGPDRDHQEVDWEELRTSQHFPPLQCQNSENILEFGDVGELPTHSVDHPRKGLGAARFIWRKICRR